MKREDVVERADKTEILVTIFQFISERAADERTRLHRLLSNHFFTKKAAQINRAFRAAGII